MTTLRLALIDGPTYAPLHDILPAFTATTGIAVEIAARLPHAELNALLAREIDAFDLVSTHIKYAPSQVAHLRALDDLLTPDDLAPFLDAPLAQCRIDGALTQLPRHTDTRLLVYRTDLIATPPGTWEELADIAAAVTTEAIAGFAFCGQPSGLFGGFFELLASAGESLQDASGRIDVTTDAATWALRFLHELHASRRVTPAAMLDWDFGDVTAAFMRGEVAMIGDWPGSFALLTDPAQSPVAERIGIARYPAGPSGQRRVYSGSHTFAITQTSRDVPAATALLRALTSVEAQLIEGRRGAIPTRRDVAAILRAEATTPFAQQRLDLLAQTVATDMISFPPLATYPRIEEIAWPMLTAALRDELLIPDALAQMQAAIDADPAIRTELAAGVRP